MEKMDRENLFSLSHNARGFRTNKRNYFSQCIKQGSPNSVEPVSILAIVTKGSGRNHKMAAMRAESQAAGRFQDILL